MKRTTTFRVTTLAAFVLMTSVVTVSAQSATDRSTERLSYYAFAAPGVWFNKYCSKLSSQNGLTCLQTSWSAEDRAHVGGGVDLRVWKRIGVATDLGLWFSNGYPGGIGSINGTYSFGNATAGKASLVPFVTGGYSIDTDGPKGGLNLGGGAIFWGRGKVGLRLEARGHSWNYGRFVEMRFGVNFVP